MFKLNSNMQIPNILIWGHRDVLYLSDHKMELWTCNVMYCTTTCEHVYTDVEEYLCVYVDSDYTGVTQ